ncbi:MAG: nitroreductase [Proteobacteria bacterium]|nr:nitroreductase [Pseudomonadota bacterium]
MRDRRSVRAFLDKPVPEEILHHILEAARFAPSGVNTQPWQVAVLGPNHREKISKAIIEARDNNVPENPDYQYYPTEWVEPYKSRRKACGLALYGALNIQIDEKEKRKVQWYKNYYFFYAPIALIFYLDAHLCKGSWMDMGMFIQNVMLAARGFGLETCPQAALAEYPDIIRTHLNLPKTKHIVCGMALGYADWAHPVNQYRTAREDISQIMVKYD